MIKRNNFSKPILSLGLLNYYFIIKYTFKAIGKTKNLRTWKIVYKGIKFLNTIFF